MVWFWKCLEFSFSRFVLTSFFSVAYCQCYITHSAHHFFFYLLFYVDSKRPRCKSRWDDLFLSLTFSREKENPLGPAFSTGFLLAQAFASWQMGSIKCYWIKPAECIYSTIKDRSFSGLNSCSLVGLSAVCLLGIRRELAVPGQVARSHRRWQTAEDQPLWFQIWLQLFAIPCTLMEDTLCVKTCCKPLISLTF